MGIGVVIINRKYTYLLSCYVHTISKNTFLNMIPRFLCTNCKKNVNLVIALLVKTIKFESWNACALYDHEMDHRSSLHPNYYCPFLLKNILNISFFLFVSLLHSHPILICIIMHLLPLNEQSKNKSHVPTWA